MAMSSGEISTILTVPLILDVAFSEDIPPKSWFSSTAFWLYPWQSSFSFRSSSSRLNSLCVVDSWQMDFPCCSSKVSKSPSFFFSRITGYLLDHLRFTSGKGHLKLLDRPTISLAAFVLDSLKSPEAITLTTTWTSRAKNGLQGKIFMADGDHSRGSVKQFGQEAWATRPFSLEVRALLPVTNSKAHMNNFGTLKILTGPSITYWLLIIKRWLFRPISRLGFNYNPLSLIKPR